MCFSLFLFSISLIFVCSYESSFCWTFAEPFATFQVIKVHAENTTFLVIEQNQNHYLLNSWLTNRILPIDNSVMFFSGIFFSLWIIQLQLFFPAPLYFLWRSGKYFLKNQRIRRHTNTKSPQSKNKLNDKLLFNFRFQQFAVNFHFESIRFFRICGGTANAPRMSIDWGNSRISPEVETAKIKKNRQKHWKSECRW